jgi:rod shape determining protein RodA
MSSLQPARYQRPSILGQLPLLLTTALLCSAGVALIYSATYPLGATGRIFVIKQVAWCSIGVIVTSVILMVDYHLLERWAPWLFAAVIIALILVWAVGSVTAGSRRWIEVGFMRFQPSEFAKPAVVIMLASCFQSRANGEADGVYGYLLPLGVVLLPMFLVMIQPDLGTAGIIVLVACSMTLFAGVSRRTLKIAAGLVAIALPIILLTGDRFLLDYQKRRLATFFNPDFDPAGAGYHIIQSQIAIGSGGLFGKGFLEGTQNQLMFLPVKHTDFIFSILAEEMGFAGCFALLALFTILLLSGITVAGRARDTFGALIAFGSMAIVFWHVVINVGMVMGLVPVVGVPLSFVSYGGSSLMVSFVCVGVTASVGMRRFRY